MRRLYKTSRMRGGRALFESPVHSVCPGSLWECELGTQRERHSPRERLGQLRLKGATIGLVPVKIPVRFGYQTQKWRVIRRGCQKLNFAPLPGAVAAHWDWASAKTTVPSS